MCSSKLGVPTDKVSVSEDGNGNLVIMYYENSVTKGKEIGVVGQTSTTEIIKQLESIGGFTRSKGSMSNF